MWAVWVALALGGIALGAGVFLFVAAHWDGMSPAARMTLVVMMVALFHGAGIVTHGSASFRTLFHALGTLAVGAAIALTAQIFHIEEHWAGGTLLWALAAAIGWYFLRDWPQGLMLAVLGPAWLAGEWLKVSRANESASEVLLIFGLLLALAYLAARVEDEALQMALRVAGAVAVFPTFIALTLMKPKVPPEMSGLYRTGWLVAVLVPFLAAMLLRVRPWWASALATAWVAWLAWMPESWSLARHSWAAVGWVAFVAWAVRDGSVMRVNVGVMGFATTVLLFYFSSVMDKLGRSLSLIALGILFLGGGWALDRWRRHLIASMGKGRP